MILQNKIHNLERKTILASLKILGKKFLYLGLQHWQCDDGITAEGSID